MTPNSSLSPSARTLAAALLLGAGAALAQAPVNDTCAGAELLTFGTGNTAVSSVVTTVSAATAAAEFNMSCSSSEKNTVWFAFTPPATGTYRVETCGRSNYTSVVEVYTGACGATTVVAGSCVTATTLTCSPGTAANVALTGGTPYLVQVGLTPTTIPSDAFVQLAVGLQTAPANDSCGGARALTLNRLTMADIQPTLTSLMPANDAQYPTDAGCFVGTGHTTTSTISVGNDVAFSFRAPATGRYSFRAEAGGPSSTPNATLWLSSSCLGGTTPVLYDGNACVAAANRNSSSTSAVEMLSCIPLTANETTYLWVDTVASTTTLASWPVEVAACFPEEENNDTVSRANALACPLTGGINPAGDVDFYRLGTYPGARVYAAIEGNATSTTDYDLRLTTATDTLEYDDDDNHTTMGSLSANIGGATLPGEDAFLRVNYGSATTVADPYRLFAMVKFGAPVPEQEPNDTPGTANDLGQYVSGTLASTAEFDYFALEARVGDQVYLSLDSNPARLAANGNANHNLQVLDPAGAQVILTSDTGDTPSAAVTTGDLNATTPIWPAEAYVFRADQNGRYVVRVSRVSAVATNIGDYHLAMSIGCGMVQPTLASLQTADGGVPEGSGVGGDVVTLLGSGFDDSTRVFFGAGAGTITARTATTLTVTTPPQAAGLVNVSVTNFGDLTSALTGAWTFIEPLIPPTVTDVSPNLGPTAGGTAVTLTGTVFKANAEVTFTVGSTTLPATNVVVVGPTSITCTTPALPAGPATVTVRNPVDNFQGSLAAAFTYVPAPTLASVTPATGLTTGGTVVTLTGTGFLDGATVRFGATAGTAVTVAGDGLSLTVSTPAAAANGAVDLRVANPDGQLATLTGGFTYVYPAPTLATLVPTRGFAVGGQTITLNGTNFLSAPVPTVTFGGAAATNVVRVSATRLTVTTPPGSGTVDVVVTNNDSQSVTSAAAFTYDPAPSVSAVSPARGPVQGGTRITLTGQSFVAGATVYVGGVPAFAPTLQSATTLVAITNAGVAGLADVVVTNPDTQSGSLAGAFTYDPAPSLTTLSPASGTSAGGTTVTLTGAGFLAGAAVRFGSTAGTAVTVTSATELTTMSPPHAVGVVTLTVENPDGQLAQLPRAYRYVSPPTLAAVAPATGDVAGGTLVRVTGTGFGAQTTVTFGGVASPRVTFRSDTALDAETPAHLPGAVDVAVVNGNGDTATLAGAFTFTRGAPTLSAVTPASGLTTGGALVSLEGKGFAAGATVRFGATAATGVVVESSTLARAVVPPGAAGPVDVTLTNDDLQAATLAAAYVYAAPPDGTANVVTDGGSGGLEAPAVDAGTGTGTGGGGCGCTSADASTLLGLGLGLVTLLRRRRR